MKQLTQQEKEDEILATKIRAIIFDLDLKRGCGVTLEKSEYIGDTTRNLEEELNKLKSKKTPPTNE